MALVSLQDITVAFGGPPVLNGANFAIERGERVCILGRNGAGKSTLMQVLDGTLTPDSGIVVRQGGVSVARLEQDVPRTLQGTMFDIVAAGLGANGELLARYHAASVLVATDHSEKALQELDRLHRQIDAANAWQLHLRVETVLQHLALDPEARIKQASGGRTRQALLARALVNAPDVLLLDEPTNHLDIDAIEWMEEYLITQGISLIFVTHDRAFLRRVATRIVELDRGRLADFGTDYDTYLERKDAMLHAEAKEWEDFDRRLAQEEVWIRTGIQARRTRNEGRVRSLEAMRVERAGRRDRLGTTRAQVQEAERSGRLVLEAQGLTFAHGDRPIVQDFSATIMRGDRVGLVGPNGSGKTTLLKLLLGELVPQAGTVRHGTNLEVAYFDQLREQLNPDQSVFESIGDGTEWVQVGGQRRHVNGYLQDFLFTQDRARTPVRALSGGERNRLLLARLFTRSFNVLVLDEPTNDLDMETLDVLEQLLLDFHGTLLLVSHDRAFIDAVVTSTLVFEGRGVVREYAGGYTDWVRQRPVVLPEVAPVKSSRPTPSSEAAPTKAKKRKLSYKETSELAALPDRIAALEEARNGVFSQLSDPAVLRDGARVVALQGELATMDNDLTVLMERWEVLETLAAESGAG
ncbi:ATP-binding cassette domain-containing protein [Gemmatimonas phototrophica]|uniref:ATP-binding protein Uup n=1 Tax=Gemmatimonas phototrophica TaxID=1379270 RepID=A0A143BKZ6_9BACT|nr:ATP-binding cassette domain-containing protein [Gemmatimonas phototrophica]AMW05265.1 ABC transporter ATPase [Gemmatimonas phototrophica]